jgi:hypothetical protein
MAIHRDGTMDSSGGVRRRGHRRMRSRERGLSRKQMTAAQDDSRLNAFAVLAMIEISPPLVQVNAARPEASRSAR